MGKIVTVRCRRCNEEISVDATEPTLPPELRSSPTRSRPRQPAPSDAGIVALSPGLLTVPESRHHAVDPGDSTEAEPIEASPVEETAQPEASEATAQAAPRGESGERSAVGSGDDVPQTGPDDAPPSTGLELLDRIDSGLDVSAPPPSSTPTLSALMEQGSAQRAGTDVDPESPEGFLATFGTRGGDGPAPPSLDADLGLLTAAPLDTPVVGSPLPGRLADAIDAPLPTPRKSDPQTGVASPNGFAVARKSDPRVATPPPAAEPGFVPARKSDPRAASPSAFPAVFPADREGGVKTVSSLAPALLDTSSSPPSERASMRAAGQAATLVQAQKTRDRRFAIGMAVVALLLAGGAALRVVRAPGVRVAQVTPPAEPAAQAPRSVPEAPPGTLGAVALPASPAADATQAPAPELSAQPSSQPVSAVLPVRVAAKPTAPKAALAAAQSPKAALAAPSDALSPNANAGEEPSAAPAVVEFDRAAALAALESAAQQASSCRQQGDPSGTASVTISFAPSGKVTSASLSGPPFQGTATGSCIAQTLRRVRIPPFTGERTTVSRTIVVE